jgi:hypothetical protein
MRANCWPPHGVVAKVQTLEFCLKARDNRLVFLARPRGCRAKRDWTRATFYI